MSNNDGVGVEVGEKYYKMLKDSPFKQQVQKIREDKKHKGRTYDNPVSINFPPIRHKNNEQ